MGKVPRFEGFRPTSHTASATLRRVRSRNTTPEVELRRALWARGVRYRLHLDDLPGRPDIVFPSQRVAVFCDGDFWHGRNWPERRRRLAEGSNAGYWIPKIEANIARDRRQEAELRRLGWSVIRIWESDIRRDPELAAAVVEEAISPDRNPLES